MSSTGERKKARYITFRAFDTTYSIAEGHLKRSSYLNRVLLTDDFSKPNTNNGLGLPEIFTNNIVTKEEFDFAVTWLQFKFNKTPDATFDVDHKIDIAARLGIDSMLKYMTWLQARKYEVWSWWKPMSFRGIGLQDFEAACETEAEAKIEEDKIKKKMAGSTKPWGVYIIYRNPAVNNQQK